MFADGAWFRYETSYGASNGTEDWLFHGLSSYQGRAAYTADYTLTENGVAEETQTAWIDAEGLHDLAYEHPTFGTASFDREGQGHWLPFENQTFKETLRLGSSKAYATTVEQRIVGNEWVTVPAGTFLVTNITRTLTDHPSGAGPIELYYWFSEDVGWLVGSGGPDQHRVLTAWQHPE